MGWYIKQKIHNMSYVLLALIIVIGLVIRLVNLNKLVLVHDEMSIGYNALSILKTGQDEWGKTFPVVFKAFGDFKLPGYVYATVLSFALFGVNDFSLKIPSLLAGILIIIGSYWLTYVLTSKRPVALLAALVLAFSPWPIHLSRLAIESNLASAFFIFGLLASIIIMQNHKPKKVWVGVLGVSMAGAVYSYVALRMLVPLYGLVMGLLIWKFKLPATRFLVAAIIFLVLVIPLTSGVLSPAGTARFNQVSIFSNENASMVVNEQRANCFIADPRLGVACKLLFNKPLTYLEQVVSNHAHFILPTFLFFDGGGDDLVYTSMPGMGEFLWILYPFYLVGLVVVWQKRTQPEWLLFFVIWILAVMPNAFAGPPQVIRGAALMPLVAIIIGMGLFASWEWVSQKKFGSMMFLLFAAGVLLLTVRSLVNYWVIYPVQYSWRAYPLPKQTVIDVLNVSDNFKRIYFHQHFPDAHIAVAWYGQFDPTWYRQSVNFPSADDVGFQHPTKLGKYEFGNLEPWDIICDPELIATTTLYVSGPDDRVPYELATRYYDPTQVHVMAQAIDLNQWQAVLKETELLDDFCQ